MFGFIIFYDEDFWMFYKILKRGEGGRKCVRYELIDSQDRKVTSKTEVKKEKSLNFQK